MPMSAAPVIRNISDTAAWVAMYRAMESERDDAVFRDPSRASSPARALRNVAK